ncbi:hypothetical protein SAMN05216337_105437 [Bradyrhizobium brasilense]|uniref:Integrase catalytic domain-containing protein n=1 Tax=Bradyrhizobium brasilense TaxID=1419277 RepID=A0A1G7KU22_9BRAD|nr:hypothetical protein SAMN05216337_105437 [Bradyrhizobium brasilense]
MIERGKSRMVISDNGSELTSNAILVWADQSRVEWHYIAPGKPMPNAFIDSFMYRRPPLMQGILGMPVGCVHVYGLLVRPEPWPLALMEIADRGLIHGSRLLRLKLFGLARSPSSAAVHMLSFALTP